MAVITEYQEIRSLVQSAKRRKSVLAKIHPLYSSYNMLRLPMYRYGGRVLRTGMMDDV